MGADNRAIKNGKFVKKMGIVKFKNCLVVGINYIN